MISRPLMLALFVLCSAPALAAQGGEGPYLFDLLKKPLISPRGKACSRERACPAGPAIMPRPSMARPGRQRAWQWAAKATRSLGCARRMNCGDNQLNVLFRREANALGCLATAGKRAGSANLTPRSKPPEWRAIA